MVAEPDMLTAAGRAEAEGLARRHDVSLGAVVALLDALRRGGGAQAQFSHPDLGGMGQWSRGGMIMVGDMFNHALKARVDQLCRDTAALLDTPRLVREARSPAASRGDWWPEGCGRPSATGGQNDMRYACFPETRRLAIERGADNVELYDTGEHRIHGVSQRQGSGGDLRFTSQLGTVTLHDLTRLDVTEPVRPGRSAPEPADPEPRGRQPQAGRPVAEPPSLSSETALLDTLERLHALHEKGVLSENEFATKKAELLGRL